MSPSNHALTRFRPSTRPGRPGLVAVALGALLSASAGLLDAQAPARSTAAAGEAATARRFSAIKHDPLKLRAFLHDMPKGGDLHNHLTGAIYAESFLNWAAEDQLCLNTATLQIVAATCDAASGRPAVADVLRNATLYGQAIDAMSMRNWDRTLNGHDHFFATVFKEGVLLATQD